MGDQMAFSDRFFLLPNNHGRVFGPSPAPESLGGVGYVWTASFSGEELGFYDGTLTHLYVSFDQARDAIAAALIGAGSTDLGFVFLDNAYHGDTATTGDADGFAAVIQWSNSSSF